jgi:hypothetical protein
MGTWRKVSAGIGALAIVAVAVVGCSASTTTLPPLRSAAASGSLPSAAPIASGIHIVSQDSSAPSEAPRVTAGSATVDKITADYTYKNELITPLAHLYGVSGFLDDFVIVTIQNDNSTPVKVVVESQVEDYTDQASDTVTVDAMGTAEVRQNPQLTMTAIDNLNSSHQAQLHVVVSYLQSGDRKTILDQTNQTLVTSRRDYPWVIQGFTQQEMFEMVAVMITPTDPGVEDLIRTASNYDPTGAMTSGYDSAGDANDTVYQRMSDVWKAETNDYRLTYISTTISFAAGQAQRIRLPAEVLSQASGNCIELTLLYAAVAEALGLDAALILVPGHAYVGISVDNSDQSYYFIETTMIGQATFDQAVTFGLSEWQDAAPHVANGETDYGWVDVPTARQDGIVPIPWH